MKYKLEKEGSLYIEEITGTDKDGLDDLVGTFKRMDSQAPQMGDKVLYDVNGGLLELETLRQFSKWCNTDVRYIKPQVKAREISYLLFKGLIPRLCDQQDRVYRKHVENYRNFLSKLKEKGLLLKQI